MTDVIKGERDPERQWWPLTHEGCHVRHHGCRMNGWVYYQCDERYAITAMACDRCTPGFDQYQLNLFDWRPK